MLRVPEEKTLAIEFVCSSCGKTLRVPDEHLGKSARCPACQTINLIQPKMAGSETEPIPAPPIQDRPVYNDLPSKPSVDYSTPPQFNPYAATEIRSVSGFRKPHRGGMVLTLGIVSLVCNLFFVPGILAWAFGNSDLKQMKAGAMDREGESLTMVGMILGIISTLLPLLGILLYVLFIILMIIVSIATH